MWNRSVRGESLSWRARLNVRGQRHPGRRTIGDARGDPRQEEDDVEANLLVKTAVKEIDGIRRTSVFVETRKLS